jgi:GH24 family phage-related lysozyme (muramidase)
MDGMDKRSPLKHQALQAPEHIKNPTSTSTMRLSLIIVLPALLAAAAPTDDLVEERSIGIEVGPTLESRAADFDIEARSPEPEPEAKAKAEAEADADVEIELDTRATTYCGGLDTTGYDFLKAREGFVKQVYTDGWDNPTIGYGHVCKQKGCAELKALGITQPLSAAEGQKLLVSDVKTFTAQIAARIPKAKLNRNQWTALVSFVFNLGPNNLSGTIANRLNRGDNPNTVFAQELPKYMYVNGKPNGALRKRRLLEVAYAKKATTHQAFPQCT